MNINKLAAKDAFKWARAEMFFGEGAGTRRKLLSAEIDQKMIKLADTDYADLFNLAYEKQNFADHAIKAAKERKKLDHSKFIKRNVRGLLTGNRQSLTTGVIIISGLVWVAKETGMDEEIKFYVKSKYRKTKHWVKVKRTEQKLRSQH